MWLQYIGFGNNFLKKNIVETYGQMKKIASDDK